MADSFQSNPTPHNETELTAVPSRTAQDDKRVTIEIEDDNNNEHDPDDEYDPDDEPIPFLKQVLDQAVSHLFGVIAAEVWVHNSTKTKLVRAPGGFFVDYVFEYSEPSAALSRLSGNQTDSYQPPQPQAPGEGLAGLLWGDLGKFQNRSIISMPGMKGRRGKPNSDFEDVGDVGATSSKRTITWRDLKLLSVDPHQAHNERLVSYAAAGFETAAGVPFKNRKHSGIVVYLARRSVEMNVLKSESNLELLYSSTDLIGAVLTQNENVQFAHSERKRRVAKIKSRIRSKLHAVRQVANARKDQGNQPFIKPSKEYNKIPGLEGITEWKKQETESLKECANTWRHKLLGANSLPPPPAPLNQIVFSVIGSFVQIFFIFWISKAIKKKTNNELFFNMGGIAALTCMQFGLTAAPAAQPGTGMIATILAGIVAITVSMIPGIPLWIRPTIAVPISIGVMQAAACVHPPAAGVAVLYSSGVLSWDDLGVLLGGYAITIVFATTIVNLSFSKQYPMFWGNYHVRKVESFVLDRKNL